MTTISTLRIYGCYLASETITHLRTFAELIIDGVITIEKETLLLSLDNAEGAVAWDESETLWEMCIAHEVDFLEVVQVCPAPNCKNKQPNLN